MVGSVRLRKLAVALTPVNWVWLSALKASRRTSILTVLPIGMVLDSDRSRLLVAGACTKNRPDSSPTLPGCGGAKQLVSSCLYGSPLEPLPGSQVSTMRAPGLPSL